ncbi:condensation domain-containing protein [Streptomyces anulatus]|uniref:condensation domain-containing protein n=1 Tax=Streptomyces anulatus TaxID=1892 RepID=UPI0022507B44|nr:condensation domain-containing protein [Streptomyces anulatus]MCX4521941.1 condensation domain-containing protein [Streptomyces anulatus]MCX4604817.1 condensation domain-containing protein [Streptomyces anulatus]WTE29641.1 condensation domain-containing protein [Streptomyces anulatus]
MTQGNVPEDLATIAHRLADEGYVLITGLLGEAELALARASHAADGRAAKELARTKLRTLSSCLHTMSGGHDPGAAEGRLRLAVVLSVAVARSGSPHPDGLHAPVAERGGKEPAAIRFGTVATPGSALLFDTRRVYVEGVGAVDGPVCLTVGPQRYGEGVAGPDADRASALAERIVGVFHEVLGEEGAGSGASFFELGGTSLEALRVVSLLREREHVRLELSDFFAQGSPAELAAIALSRCCEDEAGPGSSLRSRARRRARRYFPLSLSQEGLYAMDHGVKGAGFFNSVWWMRFQGAVDLVAVEGAVNDAVLRQPTLRTVIESHGGRPAQRVLPQPVPIGRADLRDRGGRGLRRIMAGEAARGFDLERQAPARFQLVRLADDTTALVGTVHHVAFDGVSCDLLIDEIAHAYAVRLGASDSRPELRRHYADFAEWQRDTLRGDRLAEHLDGLRAALSRPSPRIAPAPERKYGFLGHVEEFEVPEATAQRLAAAAARQGTSLFVLLVAAMTRLGTRLSGEPRQTVSVQAANRSWPGSEHIVGCFSNVLPVVGNGHEEVVPTAHAGVVEALRHEEMPFDAALSLLGDEGFDLRAGLPPLGFALQTSPGRRIELPGCAVTTGQFTETGDTVDPTPFPLVLELWEDEGLRGVVRSLRDAWPDDSYQRALGQLHGALADASLCGGR